MALIKCSECGNQVSDKAAVCPHCGAPIEVAKKPAEPVPEIKIKCETAPVFLISVLVRTVILVILGIAFAKYSDIAFGLAIVACSVCWCAIRILVMRSKSVSIADGIVTGRTGVIHTKKLSSPVGKVQDVGISNGIPGKIFGYHTIIISTAGSDGAEYVYAHMTNAKELQAAFVKLTK